MEPSHFHRAGSSTAEQQTRQPDRNATRPLPPRPQPSRTESADRKRRLTSPDQGRAYPYSMATASRHHTLGNQLGPRGHEDLAARVLPHFRPRQLSPSMADIIPNVPRWQPDEDVQKCPVCEQDFTLFFRKHHCRKCGKVVCGDCSRHRITVPLKYVAQPPWAADSVLQYTGVASPVRVCNPCVPDPWSPSENEQQQPPPVPPPDTRPRSTLHRYSLPPPPPTPPPNHQRHNSDLPRPPPYDYRHFDSHPQQGQRRSILHSESSPARAQQSDSPSRIRFIESPIPRREIKEEDECPVCGIELAPGEATREAHVASCVTTRFGSLDTARSPITPASEDAQSSPSSSLTPINRARAQSYRSRGLYQYKATEKDCVDGEGEEQECPICFEEFQPGDTLGRLECLCRFHHACIREWWVRKGPGMCPVHASHE